MMKKLFQTFRSMRFGILLLVLIAALSVVGTVIPQGREISWYTQTYRSLHGTILMLKLHDVFHSWYFQLLLVLLGLNLTLSGRDGRRQRSGLPEVWLRALRELHHPPFDSADADFWRGGALSAESNGPDLPSG